MECFLSFGGCLGECKAFDAHRGGEQVGGSASPGRHQNETKAAAAHRLPGAFLFPVNAFAPLLLSSSSLTNFFWVSFRFADSGYRYIFTRRKDGIS